MATSDGHRLVIIQFIHFQSTQEGRAFAAQVWKIKISTHRFSTGTFPGHQ